MVNIADWDKTQKKPEAPLVKSDTIAVWKAEAEDMCKTRGFWIRKMKKRIENLKDTANSRRQGHGA